MKCILLYQIEQCPERSRHCCLASKMAYPRQRSNPTSRNEGAFILSFNMLHVSQRLCVTCCISQVTNDDSKVVRVRDLLKVTGFGSQGIGSIRCTYVLKPVDNLFFQKTITPSLSQGHSTVAQK